MSDLDLDINNYSIKDIERFFGLSKIYNISDVDLRENIIREQLLSSGTVNKRFKRDLIVFLKQAKRWLITVKFPESSLKPTIIPRNEPLDPNNYPYQPPSQSYLREGDLIERKNVPFIFSKPEEFLPGNLNPLNTRVIRKCVTIDTRFRKDNDTTQSSDFTVQLPFKLLKVVSMEMNSIDLPISFYGISESYGNNFFYIAVDYMDELNCIKYSTKCVIIPNGNYNSYDLLNVLNKELSNSDDIFSNIHFSLNILESGSGTKKIILAPYPNFIDKILNITLDFSTDINGNFSNNDITTKFGWNLGFVHRQYTGFTTYVSDSVFEPTSIRYVYLSVEDFNSSVNNVFLSAFDKINLDTNILAKINIQKSDLNVPIISEPRKYFGPVDITRLRIRLYDEFGRIIDMNDTNYSFCLSFNMMYDL